MTDFAAGDAIYFHRRTHHIDGYDVFETCLGTVLEVGERSIRIRYNDPTVNFEESIAHVHPSMLTLQEGS